MKTPTLRLSLVTLAAATLPLAAQTTPAKPATTTTTVHHATTTPVHRPLHPTVCPIEVPTLSPKIPALPTAGPKCPSGLYTLSYVDIVVGTGELAAEKKWYSVKYTGWLVDGTKFDSSYDHPDAEPITFPYGAHRVIPGWDTGFQGMHVGGKRRLFVPYQLAYGADGRAPVIPAKAELIFDVELVAQSDNPPPAKTPPPAPAKPADAKPADTKPDTAPPPPPSPAGTTAPPPTTSATPSGTTPKQ